MSSHGRHTVKDLALLLGMSISTVSRAFYPDAVIAAETRKRVLAKAAEIGFQPNPLARGLITKNSAIVGVVVSDITNPFYPEVLTKLTGALQAAGLNVMLVVEQVGGARDNGLDVLLSYHPAVVVILATTLSSGASQACRAVGTPVVFFNRHAANAQSFSITCDNDGGGAAVADLLIDQGRTRLAFIPGRPDASTTHDRWAGFSRRCLERGRPTPAQAKERTFSYADGHQGATDLLQGDARIDAIFCANDLLAIGALEAVRREFGRDVAGDVAVVGFDDIAMASWPSYELTTVRQPMDEMVAATLDLVTALAHGEARQPGALRLEGRLMERSTTGAIA